MQLEPREALSLIDATLSEAHLSRRDHQIMQAAVQALGQCIESAERDRQRLSAALTRLEQQAQS